jgi:HEAT repeat protein
MMGTTVNARKGNLMRPILRPTLVLLALLVGRLDGQENPAEGTFDGQPAAFWIGQLASEDEHARRRAAYAIGRIGPAAKAAVPTLVELLEDRHGEVRWYALYALGRVGPASAEAVPTIIKSMQDKNNDKDFRHNGALALGHIGPQAKAGEPLLLAVLKSGDPTYRVRAAGALWRISQRPEAIPALLDVLRQGSGDAAYQAAMSLLEFGPDAKTAIPDLVTSLKSPDPDVRRAAAKVLGTLGTDIVQPICDALKKDDEIDRRAAADALGLALADVRTTVLYNPATSKDRFLEIVAPLHQQVVPVLGSLLSHPKPEVRTSAARALARLGPSTVSTLLSALRSPNRPTREAAFDGLERLESFLPQEGPVSPGVEEIKRMSLPALTKTLEHDDSQVQTATLRIFAALQIGSYGNTALPQLREFLRHEDALIRRYAARCREQIMKDESP